VSDAPAEPGWHPDPWGTPKYRWFDGQAWTKSVWPPDEPVAPLVPVATTSAVAEELTFARWARTALIVAVPLYLVGSLVALAQMRVIADHWDEFTRAAQNGDRFEPAIPGWVYGLQPLQFVLLGAQIVFIVWCYKAARAGRDLHMPARRSPGWAIGSWLIPILNLWWPYQSVADALPPEHPGRRVVLRWWQAWIALSVGSILLMATAWGSVLVSATAFALLSAVAVVAALNAMHVIEIVGTAHDEVTNV
jgi:hypothetical protein